MNKKIFSNKLLVVLICSLIIMAQSADAFARPRRRISRSYSHRRPGRHLRHIRHKKDTNDAVLYGALALGLVGVLATTMSTSSTCPTVRMVKTVRTVKVLPGGHRTFRVRGQTYYYCDNIYYRACPSGYIVVSPPEAIPAAMVLSPAVQELQNLPGQAVTIHVPNANGSYTPVRLVKQDEGYIGPQGEYYVGNPTVEQLKALYGK